MFSCSLVLARRTARVMSSAPASRTAASMSFREYFPEPRMKRDVKVCPPITRGSLLCCTVCMDISSHLVCMFCFSALRFRLSGQEPEDHVGLVGGAHRHPGGHQPQHAGHVRRML